MPSADDIYFMQVCLGGHKIAEARMSTFPSLAKKHCSNCGEAVINCCPECKHPIPGNIHDPMRVRPSNVPIPNHCEECGTNFPWAESPMANELQRLIDACFNFAVPRNMISPLELIPRIVQSKNLAPVRDLTGKCDIARNYYVSVRALVSASPKPTANQIAIFSNQMNAVIRAIEECLKELMFYLGCEGASQADDRNNYGRLQASFNAFIPDWEKFLKSVGVQSIGFMVLPPLADIPEHPVAPGGETVIAAGDAYGAYRAMKQLIASGHSQIFVAEPYPGVDLLEHYLDAVPESVSVRILVMKPDENFSFAVGKLGHRQKVQIEIRKSTDFHDRVFFIDDRCWVMGHSIKDAGEGKPTYLVEMSGVAPMRKEYERIWIEAKPLES